MGGSFWEDAEGPRDFFFDPSLLPVLSSGVAPGEMVEAVLRGAGANELAYLAGLSAAGAAHYCTVPQTLTGAGPLFRGTVKDFAEQNPLLREQMRNVAKRCQRCGKSNATILPFCNGCGNDLSDAPEEYTENVCMGFIYGVESTDRGPLGLSMRSEDGQVLVYDDLLARGSCHLNAIPAEFHLPDWRYLLRSPSRGLALMARFEEACWKVTREQFWENRAWREATFREGAFASAEDFRSQIYAGVNSVPSQFQIHLQYIAPTITPADYHAFLLGKRFLVNRWLPLEYITESLRALAQAPAGALADAHLMSMDAIFLPAIAQAGGPVYAEAHARAIRRYNATHRRCANWRPEFFDAVVLARHPGLRQELPGASCDAAPSAEASPVEVRPLRGEDAAAWSGVQVADLERRDKQALQSYGRPYDEHGRPTALSYYSFARRPGQVLAVTLMSIAMALGPLPAVLLLVGPVRPGSIACPTALGVGVAHQGRPASPAGAARALRSACASAAGRQVDADVQALQVRIRAVACLEPTLLSPIASTGNETDHTRHRAVIIGFQPGGKGDYMLPPDPSFRASSIKAPSCNTSSLEWLSTLRQERWQRCAQEALAEAHAGGAPAGGRGPHAGGPSRRLLAHAAEIAAEPPPPVAGFPQDMPRRTLGCSTAPSAPSLDALPVQTSLTASDDFSDSASCADSPSEPRRGPAPLRFTSQSDEAAARPAHQASAKRSRHR
ncbi:unnamed protein product, partial [Prorocentrum cordatum]